MHLFNNSNSKIIDAKSGRQYSLNELRSYECLAAESRVLVCAFISNSVEDVAFLIAALRSNNAVALFSRGLDENKKDDLVSAYKPTFIYDSSRSNVQNYLNLESHLFRSEDKPSIPVNSDIKLLLSTSGSTGSPKLVKLSKDNILCNAKAIESYLPIESTDIVPLNLPLNYSYGFSILTSNCLKDSTLVCGLPDVLSKEFWSYFSNYGFSTLAGVPFVYEMLDRIGFLKKEYPSLRYMTQAGGRLRDSLVRKFATHAQNCETEFYVMYGQTEATARMSYMPPNDLLNNIGSIGKPIPGGNFTIDDNNNELIYRGFNVYGGYANSKMDLASFELNETLRTGDLAEINENGFYVIKGRSKRFIKLFGNRINLDEVQRSVSDEFKRQIICFGKEDKKLVLAYQDKIDAGEVKKWLNKEYKIHQGSIDFLPLKELPLTQNGKVNYQKLMEIYGS